MLPPTVDHRTVSRKHRYFQSQLAYDHSSEFLPPYTQALVDKEHALIGEGIRRYKLSDKIRILDIGCGPGDFSEQLNEHIHLYFGVDPSITELNSVKPNPGRYLAHGIGEYLDYLAENYFDAVLFISVLDHCVDWEKAMLRCAQLLRPGGLMIVAMENRDHLLNRLRRILGRKVEHSGHMHYLALRDIADCLNGGFTVLETTTFGYGFGLHSLNLRVPIPKPVFSFLMPAMDAIGGLLSPTGGQALFGCYRKKPDPSVRPTDHFLVCPACKASLSWQARVCDRCERMIPYVGQILDALTMGGL